MLRVFVRVTPSVNKKSRPDWYDPAVGVASLCDAVESARRSGVDVVSHACVDTSSLRPLMGAVQEQLSRFDHVVEIRGGSAAKSWRALLRHVRRTVKFSDGDGLYFAEDDHLHTPDSLLTVGAAGDYQFLYASEPDLESSTATDLPNWRAVNSGITSFGVRGRIFRADWKVHYFMSMGGGAWDELTCRALGNGAVDPFGRGLKYIMGAFKPVPRTARGLLAALRQSVFRLIALLIGKVGQRRVMLTPTPAVATHAESGLLAPGVDWNLVANVRGTSDGH